jgi:hypothetical protein
VGERRTGLIGTKRTPAESSGYKPLRLFELARVLVRLDHFAIAVWRAKQAENLIRKRIGSACRFAMWNFPLNTLLLVGFALIAMAMAYAIIDVPSTGNARFPQRRFLKFRQLWVRFPRRERLE